MAEGENNEMSVSETTRKKDDDDRINVNYWSLWDEIKNWHSYFKWSNLTTGIVFELLPSVWDMGSDFALAGKWSKERKLELYAAFTYFFLSIPGLLMGLKTLYNRVLRRYCTCSFTERWICKFMGYIIFMTLIGSFILTVVLIIFWAPGNARWVLFTTAIMTSIFNLSTKLLRVLVHGPEMKKLSVKMSAVEGQHESTFQLMLISALIIKGRINLGTSEIMGITSSLVMIAKSGAENLLTFGSTNKLNDKGFFVKWKMLLSLTPVLTLTCLFRVMTAVLCDGRSLLGTFALPMVVLLLLKIFLTPLSFLTPLDILQGVVAEISIPSIWGNVGREKSRNLQLASAICHLLVNTGCLIATISNPSIFEPDYPYYPSTWIQSSDYNIYMVQPIAITALVCGWISFPLHLYQIYWAECWDKLQVLATV